MKLTVTLIGNMQLPMNKAQIYAAFDMILGGVVDIDFVSEYPLTANTISSGIAIIGNDYWYNVHIIDALADREGVFVVYIHQDTQPYARSQDDKPTQVIVADIGNEKPQYVTATLARTLRKVIQKCC